MDIQGQDEAKFKQIHQTTQIRQSLKNRNDLTLSARSTQYQSVRNHLRQNDKTPRIVVEQVSQSKQDSDQKQVRQNKQRNNSNPIEFDSIKTSHTKKNSQIQVNLVPILNKVPSHQLLNVSQTLKNPSVSNPSAINHRIASHKVSEAQLNFNISKRSLGRFLNDTGTENPDQEINYSDFQSFKDSYLKQLKDKVRNNRNVGQRRLRTVQKIPITPDSFMHGSSQRKTDNRSQNLNKSQNKTGYEEESVILDSRGIECYNQQNERLDKYVNVTQTDEFDCGNEFDKPEQRYKNIHQDQQRTRGAFFDDLNATMVQSPSQNQSSKQQSHVDRYLNHIDQGSSVISLGSRKKKDFKTTGQMNRKSNAYNTSGKLNRSQQSQMSKTNKSKDSSVIIGEQLSISDRREMILRQPEPEEQSERYHTLRKEYNSECDPLIQSNPNQQIIHQSDNFETTPQNNVMTPQFEQVEYNFEQRKNQDITAKPLCQLISINSKKFDPVYYMSKHFIKGRKYHSAIPQSYSDCDIIMRFDPQQDMLKIFKIKGESETLFQRSVDAFEELKLNWDKKINQDALDLKSDRFLKLPKNVLQFKISDIQGFIYGSFSSRFWMMKIGMNELLIDNSLKAAQKEQRHAKIKSTDQIIKAQFNNMTSNNTQKTNSVQTEYIDQDGFINEIPFFAWECITIHLYNRDINLVIKDEQQMKIFILFLIKKLNSFDGQKNSMQMLKDLKCLPKNGQLSNDVLLKFYKRFLLMKIRMKISYHACIDCRTILEQFLIAILKTYHIRKAHGLIKNAYPIVTKKMLDGIKELCMSKIVKNDKKQPKTKDKIIKNR